MNAIRSLLTLLSLSLLAACNTQTPPQIPTPVGGSNAPFKSAPLTLTFSDSAQVLPEHLTLSPCDGSPALEVPGVSGPVSVPAGSYCALELSYGGKVLHFDHHLELKTGEATSLVVTGGAQGGSVRSEHPGAVTPGPGGADSTLSALGSYKQVRTYTAARAAAYAVNYAQSAYGTVNPFGNYNGLGGNCTNFVNQALLAGLMQGGDTPNYAYTYRDWFYDESGSYTLYWKSDSVRTPTWTDANFMRSYMLAQNNTAYSGINFAFITRDSPTTSLDVGAIAVGDIISADWQNDGVFDHTMIVTGLNTSTTGYGRILVTYQNAAGYVTRVNYPLNLVNSANTVFFAFRPLQYTP